MTSDAYTAALRKAKSDLLEAIQQRDYWNVEIAKRQQLVSSLSAAADPEFGALEDALTKNVGISDLVLSVINRTSGSMTPVQVKQALALAGYSTKQYANATALIHQTLKRLKDQNKIQELAPGIYKRAPLFDAFRGR